MGAEEVVGALLAPADPGATLDLDFAVLGDEAGLVLDVPAEGAEERVEEFLAETRLVIVGTLIGGEVLCEDLDQAGKLALERVNADRGGHATFFYRPAAANASRHARRHATINRRKS
jgi:hypothetical protein